jgi:hypothetical protein
MDTTKGEKSPLRRRGVRTDDPNYLHLVVRFFTVSTSGIRQGFFVGVIWLALVVAPGVSRPTRERNISGSKSTRH